jgi:hypothetical protein
LETWSYCYHKDLQQEINAWRGSAIQSINCQTALWREIGLGSSSVGLEGSWAVNS